MSVSSIGIRASKPTLPPGVPPGTVPLYYIPPTWPWRLKSLAPANVFGSAGWSTNFTGGWRAGGFEAKGNTITSTHFGFGVGPDVPDAFPVTWRPTIVMVMSITCSSVFGTNPLRARIRSLSQSVYSANLVPAGTANPYAVAIVNTAGLSSGGIREFNLSCDGAKNLRAANIIFVGYIGPAP